MVCPTKIFWEGNPAEPVLMVMAHIPVKGRYYSLFTVREGTTLGYRGISEKHLDRFCPGLKEFLATKTADE